MPRATARPIIPPVEVPTMRSKHSTIDFLVYCSICDRSAAVKRPRIPPPSRERIRNRRVSLIEGSIPSCESITSACSIQCASYIGKRCRETYLEFIKVIFTPFGRSQDVLIASYCEHSPILIRDPKDGSDNERKSFSPIGSKPHVIYTIN